MTAAGSIEEPVRVAIDVRIPAGEWGGVEFVAKSLVEGLVESGAGIEASLIGYEGEMDWLKRLALDRLRPVAASRDSVGRLARQVNGLLKKSSLAQVAARSRASAWLASLVAGPRRDDLIEQLGVEVVHFVSQRGSRTAIPSIYQPHDLQHVHLPQYFTPAQRAYRDRAYRLLCDQAEIVVVMTEWGRTDLVTNFGIPRNKIAVVPWAPVIRHAQTSAEPPLDLPSEFMLFPAQTWPHKNHLRLLEAIAMLRDRGLRVDLINIGRLNEYYPEIAKRVQDLRIQDRVRFLGFVDDSVVESLYQRATTLVFPSLFEGWGLPVIEAFRYGVPVAASNATVLPEVTHGAAELFDPMDVEDMARSIERVTRDDALRTELVSRGLERSSQFSWARTAATFAGLYRRVAGRAPMELDGTLLASPTLVETT